MRWLTAIPVYNEAAHIHAVLGEVRRYSSEILVVSDGSTDDTPRLLAAEQGIRVLTHAKNRGYGAALVSAFDYARTHGFDSLVTMDCDGQHEPSRIPVLLEAMCGADIVSGSRYLRDFRQDTAAPARRGVGGRGGALSAPPPWARAPPRRGRRPPQRPAAGASGGVARDQSAAVGRIIGYSAWTAFARGASRSSDLLGMRHSWQMVGIQVR